MFLKVLRQRMVPVQGLPCVQRWFLRSTKIPVRADVAMTGEITLRGEVYLLGD